MCAFVLRCCCCGISSLRLCAFARAHKIVVRCWAVLASETEQNWRNRKRSEEVEETAVRREFFHEDDNSGGTSWRKKEVKAGRKSNRNSMHVGIAWIQFCSWSWRRRISYERGRRSCAGTDACCCCYYKTSQIGGGRSWRRENKGAAVATETVEAAGEGEYKIVAKSD